MHGAADAGQHAAGDERAAAGSRDNRNDDSAENLHLRGAGNQHAENRGEQRKNKRQCNQRHIHRGNPVADGLFNAERNKHVAHTVGKEHERGRRNHLHQAVGDILCHVRDRHLLLRLLVREQDGRHNDQCRDEQQQAVVQRGGTCAELALEKVFKLRGQQERHEYNNREENGFPAVFQRLAQRRNVFLLHRRNLVIPAHEIQCQDPLRDKPDCNSPQQQPVLGKRILFGIQCIQDAECRCDHAGRRDHVAHGGAVRFHVGGEMRREAGTLHGRNREHAGRRHVAGAGAGQRAHVGGADDGHETCTAAKPAEDGKDNRDEIIDDRRLGQQMRRDDKHDDDVET